MIWWIVKLRLKPVVRFVNRKAWKSRNHKNRKATEVQCITRRSGCSQWKVSAAGLRWQIQLPVKSPVRIKPLTDTSSIGGSLVAWQACDRQAVQYRLILQLHWFGASIRSWRVDATVPAHFRLQIWLGTLVHV